MQSGVREKEQNGDGMFATKRMNGVKKKDGGPEVDKVDKESVMMELTRMVQQRVTESSWWDKRGKDILILISAFVLLPPAFLCLSSSHPVYFCTGILLMGFSHGIITTKGAHLATHGSLSDSHTVNNIWAVFIIEICGGFSSRAGIQGHIKMHHAHTNIIGLGDSSVWKVPFLSRATYLFIAPLTVPIITPLMAMAYMKDQPVPIVCQTLFMISVGFYSQFWLLMNVSGFTSAIAAVTCMWVCRAMFSIPYIHVNIFQHIGLPMYSPQSRPKRVYQMTSGVLNLPRNILLDLVFGHSLINCHVEHHLFPFLSDNMCLKVKPIVSKYLLQKNLPYQQDSYFNRLTLFYDRYEELMVLAPPITQLVGVQ